MKLRPPEEPSASDSLQKLTVMVTLVTFALACLESRRFTAENSIGYMACVMDLDRHYGRSYTCGPVYRVMISFVMLGAVAVRSERSVFFCILGVDAFLLLSFFL